MKEEDILFMNENRWAVESYSQESPPRNMRMIDRENLVRIVRENFNKKASPDLWCPSCLATFIINAYQLYDKYTNDGK